jgi:hypothetical protein
MHSPSPLALPQAELTAYFLSHQGMRSRSVSSFVPTAVLSFPTPSRRLIADWEREIKNQLCLEPGDVEEMSLRRARARWLDYKHCVQALADWTYTLGLVDILSSSEVALMACRGARYHHDAAQYGSSAFSNLFLSQDKGLDLHFPSSGQRIPLIFGTAVIFDTGQPHAVIERNSHKDFDVNDFKPEKDCSQFFLTWELPIENAQLAHLLGIRFDTHTATASQLSDEQVWFENAPAMLCPASGRWKPIDAALRS